MTHKELLEYIYISKNVLILDGAMGTQLQKYGMPKGVCPEEWILENPQIAQRVQREYVEAGSGILYAPTFGANAVKLKNTALAADVVGVNARLVALSKQVAGSALVAGDISPLGVLMDLSGQYTFCDCVEVYKEQIRGLVAGGADLLVLETFIDIEEARAAAIAAKEVCDLAVIATFAFDQNGRLLTGADGVTALFTMKAAGVTAFGANCGVGPEAMLKTIEGLAMYADLPLIAKPNAGLPKLDESGNTYFDMAAAEFSSYAKAFVQQGVGLMGGCCGTAPEFVAALKAELEGVEPVVPSGKKAAVLTSPRMTVFIDEAYTVSQPVDISSGDIDDIIDEVLDASDDDVICLYAKAGSGVDVCRIIDQVCKTVRQPLVFQFEDEKLKFDAKRCYCGISNLE